MKFLIKTFYQILFIILIFFLSYVFYWKFIDIPNGVDSGAHLFRTLYLYNNLKSGFVPLWNDLWYAGSPFLLLYGPFAFYLTMPFSFLFDPITAYKIIEIIFFLFSAFSVFRLTKKISGERWVAFLSAFFVIISPFTIFNFIIVDRFATIVEQFFFINSIYFLICLYQKQNAKNVFSLASFSTLTFLSQGFGIIILLIFFLIAILIKRSLKFFNSIFLSIVIALIISSLWLILALPNFIYNIINPFANVWTTQRAFDYARVMGTLFFLGPPSIIIFLFSFKLVKKIRIIIIILMIILTVLGTILFQNKYNVTQTVFALSSLLTITFIILNKFSLEQTPEINILKWFGFISIILSACLPIYAFTFLKVLDPYRVAYFTTVPIAVISALACKKSRISILIITSIFILISFSLISASLDYWPSVKIDEKLINILKNSPEGRFIAPEPPTWIHILPTLTGKPSIDGLSPYEKFLPELRKLRNQHFGLWFDASLEEREKIYDNFIYNSEKYSIKYVIITKGTGIEIPNVPNELIYSSNIFEVYMLRNNVSFIKGGKLEKISPNEYKIIPTEKTVLFKQAYAPGWKMSCGVLSTDKDGFMLITGDCKEIILSYQPNIFQDLFKIK